MKTKAQKALAGRAAQRAMLRDILLAAQKVGCFTCGVPLTVLALTHHDCKCKALVLALNRALASVEAARSAPVSRPSRRGGTHPAQQLPKKEPAGG